MPPGLCLVRFGSQLECLHTHDSLELPSERERVTKTTSKKFTGAPHVIDNTV